jgi:hypothetical protein
MLTLCLFGTGPGHGTLEIAKFVFFSESLADVPSHLVYFFGRNQSHACIKVMPKNREFIKEKSTKYSFGKA